MIRTNDSDGSVHYSQLKKLALSGVQYLHACNTETEPTSDMLVGTAAHFILFGERQGAKELVVYKGGIRRGAAWDLFLAEHPKKIYEILNEREWDDAEQMAESVRRSPLAQARIQGAKLEVPMTWDENGIPCSTSGIDLIALERDVGDFKTTATTHPETFMRHSFRMLYPQQLAFYRRACRANGLEPRGSFILGVERKAPFEVVDLDMTEAMIDFADRSVSLWLEKLRNMRTAIPEPKTIYDWPGYAESPIPWDVPKWAAETDDEDEAA